jgi:hypothetical protein
MIVAQLVKEFYVFYGTKRFITVFTKALHPPVLSQRLISLKSNYRELSFKLHYKINPTDETCAMCEYSKTDVA